MVDGDLIRNWESIQLDKQAFVKVRIIAGTNTDEGTAFGPVGINTTEQYQFLTGKTQRPPSHAPVLNFPDGGFNFQRPPSIAKEILHLYPDDPSKGIPEYLGDQLVASMGYEWRRTSALAGDFAMHAK